MRGDRLLAILLTLQAEGKLSQRELARRLEVSERTIQRDMDALGSAGIPVVSERGSAGGWKLLEGYRTDATGMTGEEWKALILSSGSRAARDLGLADALESALLKLRAAGMPDKPAVAASLTAKLHIDADGWHELPEPQPELALLFEAVLTDQQVEAWYEPRSGAQAGRMRCLLPLGLVMKGNAWYLAASEGDAVKSFRTSRLSEIRLTGTAFVRPAAFSLAEWWRTSVSRFLDGLPSVLVTLKASPEAVARMQKMRYARIAGVRSSEHAVSSAEMEETASSPGQQLVDVRFDTLDYAASVVLSLAPEAEAVEPPELRQWVCRLAEAALEKHRNA
ncbi:MULTISPECIES: YafY family protein [unclassified Paenibacillus]|uniref:helix-turn-helix transcriptional regulator n=1 Tax=unclassified Paenibacillus TaxID=185978 RepID=UPI00095487E3|nr:MULTISPECIES: YafY family protein [unclassified Paenibacillus]ASS66304.1 YafY family transcriptional regulator [Paenibacillus sp. RUD330]SIQ08492.1 Predicted DNA-binding transcriptional regulator YafY, contains an HTH and WYL domains [Paenibacillus sp. RU4X]SIQ28580.1 Predicted DNA-binding transcriptional regulator YafY, contains an HTH and WYL domains [Paenibacillus sp. RU4T]